MVLTSNTPPASVVVTVITFDVAAVDPVVAVNPSRPLIVDFNAFAKSLAVIFPAIPTGAKVTSVKEPDRSVLAAACSPVLNPIVNGTPSAFCK